MKINLFLPTILRGMQNSPGMRSGRNTHKCDDFKIMGAYFNKP
jgi:hypothetical protein